MRVATWNINSVRTRVDRAVAFLERNDVDVLAMQETKCSDDKFPYSAFEAAGYEVAHVGYHQWNGVAIISRVGLEDVKDGFDGQPGEEVVFPWRSFEAYPIFAHIAGATPVPVPLTPDHRVDLAALAAAVTERTRLIFVCNPNNPTGTTVSAEEFAEFMRAVPKEVIVALDEAYFEYNLAGDSPVATAEISKYSNVVGLRTFSKAYGLAGARIGYAFGPAAIIDALNKVAVPFSVSSIAQTAAVASLQAEHELRARISVTVAQRQRLVETLRPYGTPDSQTNFVWIPAQRLPANPAEVTNTLANNGVLVRAFDDGLRITVTNAGETDAFLEAWDTTVGR